jgi:hypothetical protein
MTPRVVHETLFGNVAGQFVEQDGWVKIVVGATFFDDRAAAHAILCHELCHYVLEANGIREQSTLENERLTDAAIFVFGLGDIFLAGYRRSPNTQYRIGHRLGYLRDDEYGFVNKYVAWLRGSEHFLLKAKRRKDHWNWDSLSSPLAKCAALEEGDHTALWRRRRLGDRDARINAT